MRRNRVTIEWMAPLGDDAGTLEARAPDEDAEFGTYAAALAWARARSDRIEVWIGGMNRWDAPPGDDDAARIEAHIRRSRDRFEAEQRAYEEPVAWFRMVLNLDTSSPDAVAEAAAAAPHVLTARVDRRSHHGLDEVRLVLTINAHSLDEARRLSSDVLFPLIWPKERRAAELGPGGWMIPLVSRTSSGTRRSRTTRSFGPSTPSPAARRDAQASTAGDESIKSTPSQLAPLDPGLNLT